MISILCHKCGVEFRVYPYKIRKGWGRYCSKSCSSRSRVFTEASKEKMRQAQLKNPNRYWLGKKRDYLPWSGFQKGQEAPMKGRRNEKIRGEKHWNWKGGITPRPMSSLEYKQWRTGVFERDNYICQMCFKRGGYLEADHIKRWVDFPELRFELSNGRTLCRPCHKFVTFGVKANV